MHAQPTVESQAWKQPALLAALGCGILCIGLLIYLMDREASRAVLLPSLAMPGSSKLFGTLGQWLPSFVHPLGFSLFTAAVLKPTTARLIACAFWAAANVAFEVGQHAVFKPGWAEALHGGAGEWAVTRAILNYGLHGTFDAKDLSAAVLGALAAAVFIKVADRIQEAPHANT